MRRVSPKNYPFLGAKTPRNNAGHVDCSRFVSSDSNYLDYVPENRIAHLKPIFGMNDTIPHLVPYMASIPNPTRPLSRHLPTANRPEDASLPVSRQSPRIVSTRLLIIPAHFRRKPQSG